MTWETGIGTITVLAIIWLVIAIQRARGRLPVPSDREIREAMQSPEDPEVPGDFNGDGIPDSMQNDTR